MAREYFEMRDANAGFVADLRHFPVQIGTFFGESTERLARAYFEWSNEVASEVIARGQKYVLVSDNTSALRPPATVRKLVSELIDAGPEGQTDALLATFVVFDSALVRGAVTAMQWLSNREWRLTTAATVHEAIERALLVLDAAGLARPPGLSPATYVAPALPPVGAR
jgi:hypothetical protein